jgi:hypothetical protein
MGDVLSTIGDGLSFAFQMAWEVWWALILGFLLTVYFCSSDCRASFEANPDRYAPGIY